MAFPSTYQIADDFDRATLGPYWQNDPFAWGSSPFTITANELDSQAGDSQVAYTGMVVGADWEVYLNIAQIATAGTIIGFSLAIGSLVAHDGYELFCTQGGTDDWGIQRRDNDAPTVLGATLARDMVVGDQMGLRKQGSVITAFINGEQILQRTDATYSGPGYLTIEAEAQMHASFFGGGTFGQPISTPTPPMIYGRGAA